MLGRPRLCDARDPRAPPERAPVCPARQSVISGEGPAAPDHSADLKAALPPRRTRNFGDRSRGAFTRQASLIRQRLLAGTILQSDETSVRVGKQTWWTWVFHHADNACFVIRPSRGKDVMAAFLGEHRPQLSVSDRLPAQMGWAKGGHQVCLAHLLRALRRHPLRPRNRTTTMHRCPRLHPRHARGRAAGGTSSPILRRLAQSGSRRAGERFAPASVRRSSRNSPQVIV
jgi:hypothetical protein